MDDCCTLVAALAERLIARNRMLATVESCTGGALAKLLTSHAGASRWFYGSWVTYHNVSKVALGVPANLIALHGAVSQEVACEMSRAGALAMYQSYSEMPSIVVAITGIAGPDGGSTEKPVGTVWIATTISHGRRKNANSFEHSSIQTEAKHFLFQGNRDEVRIAATKQALAIVLQVLSEPTSDKDD